MSSTNDSVVLHKNDSSLDSDPVLDIGEFFSTLWRRKWIILLTTMLLVGAVLLLSQLFPRNYVAKARVLLDPRGLEITGRDLTPKGKSTSVNEELVESQLRVMTSDEVLKHVVQKLELADDRDFGAKKPQLLDQIKNFTKTYIVGVPNKPVAKEEKALRILRRDIAAQKSKKSYLVDLWVKTPNAEKSALIANEIAETFINSDISMRSGFAKRTSDALAIRLEELRKQLQESEQAVEDYKAKHNIIGTAGSPLFERELAQLNIQIAAEASRKAQAEARYQQIAQMKRNGNSVSEVSEVISSPMIGQLKAQFGILNQRKAELSKSLLPSHPQLQVVDEQIRFAEKQIKTEAAKFAKAAKFDFERAKQSEKQLQLKMKQLKKDAIKSNLAQVKLRDLEREADASRSVYQSFLVRAREIAEQQSVNTSTSRLVSPALAPIGHVGIPLSLLLAGALLGGGFLGSVFAFLAEQMNKLVRSVRQLNSASNVPNLARVRYKEGSSLFGLTGNRRRHILHASNMYMTESALNKKLNKLLRSNEVLEAGRLRELLKSEKETENTKSVVLTSTTDREGKSKFAMDLALVAGARGEKVLVLDGDLENRRTSFLYGGKVERGLRAVTEGLALDKAVQKTAHENVFFLPIESDLKSTKPITLSYSEAEKLLEECKEKFDFIVIDGGVVDRNVASPVLTKVADNVVMVAREDVTTHAKVVDAVRLLSSVREKLRGTVLMAS